MNLNGCSIPKVFAAWGTGSSFFPFLAFKVEVQATIRTTRKWKDFPGWSIGFSLSLTITQVSASSRVYVVNTDISLEVLILMEANVHKESSRDRSFKFRIRRELRWCRTMPWRSIHRAPPSSLCTQHFLQHFDVSLGPWSSCAVGSSNDHWKCMKIKHREISMFI